MLNFALSARNANSAGRLWATQLRTCVARAGQADFYLRANGMNVCVCGSVQITMLFGPVLFKLHTDLVMPAMPEHDGSAGRSGAPIHVLCARRCPLEPKQPCARRDRHASSLCGSLPSAAPVRSSRAMSRRPLRSSWRLLALLPPRRRLRKAPRTRATDDPEMLATPAPDEPTDVWRSRC